MDVPFDFSSIFAEPIQKLDRATLIRFNPRKYWAVAKVIDDLGLLSTQAQGLKRVLTSYDRVIDQQDEQTIYLMWKSNPSKATASIVLGLLKVGKKKLYLLDEQQQHYEETALCVLDFYIHEKVQRRGNGHELFEFMLNSESTSAAQLAIDRPSMAFLQFLSKFYHLSDPIWQSTNFVTFPQFYENLKPVERNDQLFQKTIRSEKFPRNNNTRNCSPSPRGKTSAGSLIHNDYEPDLPKVHTTDSPSGRKNTRDFGHTSIW